MFTNPIYTLPPLEFNQPEQRLIPPLYFGPPPPMVPRNKPSFNRCFTHDIFISSQERRYISTPLQGAPSGTRHNNGLYNTEVTTLPPHELTNPFVRKANDRRGGIVKKCLKYSIDVACIPITIPDDNFSRTQDQLTILEKLRDSSNILKFYGLSRDDNQFFMIFEWAELGNLLEVYNIYDISWNAKNFLLEFLFDLLS
ncbi:13299_t:CDS:2 [Funneliformis mosseae]|uniref:13299_t:CDS:1 n=1 Tax=Funneliformis mosseae TaxID=27381 RepID=A0A9N9G9W4_FUNMO|nr:13299_t:CDS:2 [Funneliformis mosseae]